MEIAMSRGDMNELWCWAKRLLAVVCAVEVEMMDPVGEATCSGGTTV
jgi:hypothetical protein